MHNKTKWHIIDIMEICMMGTYEKRYQCSHTVLKGKDVFRGSS